MLENIAPGTAVEVKVVKTPTSERATKTLVRLLSKDRAVMADNARLRKIRKTQISFKQRGGRLDWANRVVKQRPVVGAVGESGKIKATCDVLRDLKSVARFVEVSAV